MSDFTEASTSPYVTTQTEGLKDFKLNASRWQLRGGALALNLRRSSRMT